MDRCDQESSVEQRCSSFMQATMHRFRHAAIAGRISKDGKKCLIIHIVVSDRAPRLEKDGCSPHLGSASPSSTSSTTTFVMILFESQHLSAAAH
jgi:hypothetical protein